MSLKPRAYVLSDHGGVLATRELGRTVGRELQDALVDAPGLVLSFAGVEVASPPFLDELLASIHASLHGGEANKLLVLDGLNDDVKESLLIVLERRKLALANLEDDQIKLLGGSRQLKETLREAQHMGEFSAPELAERLEIKLPALHQRLQALLETGAVGRTRETTGERGRHAYRAPKPRDLEALTTS
jgi:DNA-binding MarR family transcriptional regulator